MKIAAVSGDLLIKLALVAGGIAIAWHLVQRARAGMLQAGAAVGQAVDSVIAGVNPADNRNVVNTAVNALGGAIVSADGSGRNADGSWSFGGFVYDVFHADPLKRQTVTAPPDTLNLDTDYYDVPTLGFGA